MTDHETLAELSERAAAPELEAQLNALNDAHAVRPDRPRKKRRAKGK